MIKKSDLRSEFERIVFRKDAYYFGEPIEDYRINIVPSGSCFKIALECFANSCWFDKDGYFCKKRDWFVLQTSYPFRDYKSAYRVVVRL